jgi:hypothetical protein
MLLHALADDFNLNANADTERGEGVYLTFTAYLSDTVGNRLTDPAGNYLTAQVVELQYPQILHTLPDDFHLNAE